MKLLLASFLLLTVTCSSLVFENRAGAVSESVVLSQIYLGNTGVSGHEFISIFNSADDDVDITNWCLQFAQSTTYREIRCFTTAQENIRLFLRSKGQALAVSETFASTLAGYDFLFSNNSNIPGTNGSIRLVNEFGNVIDSIGWGTGLAEGIAQPSLANGKIFSRLRDIDSNFIDTDNNTVDFEVLNIPTELIFGALYDIEIGVDLCQNISGNQTILPLGLLEDGSGNCFEDFCPNLEGLQLEAPVGYEKREAGAECLLVPLSNLPILITEILPNSPSSDTGNEFIELYNPNSSIVDLSGYKIQIGPSFSKEFIFTAGSIAPGQYLIFSDIQTGIVLPNSNGVILRIISPAGNVVGQTEVYSNADDDVSWALVDDKWIYTNQITPGSANLAYIEPAVDEEVNVTTVLAPCPAGKYRNPATNRCRNIETAVSSLVPCDEDEYRNTETNRCRKISTASSLTPCDEGEERNPETNRCRKAATLASVDTALTSVEDIESASTPAGINWLIVLVALSGTFAYMAYEWRFEIRQKLAELQR